MASNGSLPVLTTMVIFTLDNTTIPPALSQPGIMSRDEHEFYSNIMTWIKAICQPVSVVCLVLSAAVFLQKGMRNPSTYFLVALNLAEAYNVSMLTVYQICSLWAGCKHKRTYVQANLWTTTFLGLACRRCVYMYSCLVSVQRFLVIALPVRSKKMCLVQRPLLMCVLALLCTLVAHIYIPLRYQPVTSMGQTRAGYTQLARDHHEIFSAVSTAVMSIFVFATLTIGGAFNIGMVITLKRHARSVQILNSSRTNRQNQITAVVLTSTVLLFLLSLPSNLNTLLTFMLDSYGTGKREHYLYRTLSEAFVIAQVLSDVVIFFSNICISSAFRQQFMQMVGSLLCLRQVKSVCRKAKSSDDEASADTRLSTLA